MAIIVAVTYMAIQSIENNLLVPRIMCSTLNLHPALVIIGVLGGVTLGGILGALLASPTLATLRHVMRYVYFKLADSDPFPPPPSFATQMKERQVRAILFDLDGTLLDTDDMLVDQIAGKLSPVAFVDRLYTRRRFARKVIMALETISRGARSSTASPAITRSVTSGAARRDISFSIAASSSPPEPA